MNLHFQNVSRCNALLCITVSFDNMAALENLASSSVQQLIRTFILKRRLFLRIAKFTVVLQQRLGNSELLMPGDTFLVLWNLFLEQVAQVTNTVFSIFIL